jgi:hypothetical protein
MNIIDLSAELGASLDELCRVCQESRIYSMSNLVFSVVEGSAYASTPPAVAPAIKECTLEGF